jgi:hypothetical protein
MEVRRLIKSAGGSPVPYDRRDLIGHWIRKEQRTQRPCTHACCRGYRVHPDNYPTVLPSRTLRRASDRDLATHFQKVSTEDTPQARYAENQILYEMERRDRDEQQRAARREAVTAGRAARQMERESETERIYLEAEEYTRGNWTNLKGTARGIADREILTGRESVFQRYASEEAREFFQYTPRPTAAYFRGKRTTIDFIDAKVRR